MRRKRGTSTGAEIFQTKEKIKSDLRSITVARAAQTQFGIILSRGLKKNKKQEKKKRKEPSLWGGFCPSGAVHVKSTGQTVS